MDRFSFASSTQLALTQYLKGPSTTQERDLTTEEKGDTKDETSMDRKSRIEEDEFRPRRGGGGQDPPEVPEVKRGVKNTD